MRRYFVVGALFLAALIACQVADAQYGFVSKVRAGTGVSVSPTSGQGVVTLSTTGAMGLGDSVTLSSTRDTTWMYLSNDTLVFKSKHGSAYLDLRQFMVLFKSGWMLFDQLKPATNDSASSSVGSASVPYAYLFVSDHAYWDTATSFTGKPMVLMTRDSLFVVKLVRKNGTVGLTIDSLGNTVGYSGAYAKYDSLFGYANQKVTYPSYGVTLVQDTFKVYFGGTCSTKVTTLDLKIKTPGTVAGSDSVWIIDSLRTDSLARTAVPYGTNYLHVTVNKVWPNFSSTNPNPLYIVAKKGGTTAGFKDYIFDMTYGHRKGGAW